MSHDDDETLGVRTRLGHAWGEVLLATRRRAGNNSQQPPPDDCVESIDLMQQAEKRRIARLATQASDFYGENRVKVGAAGIVLAILTFLGFRRYSNRNKS